jgi:AcrR family transcriptional regulator
VSSGAASTRRRLPGAEREQRILDVAEREFEQHGFRGASMEQIAQRSGITKALVYQYRRDGATRGYVVTANRATLTMEVQPPSAARWRAYADGRLKRASRHHEMLVFHLPVRPRRAADWEIVKTG